MFKNTTEKQWALACHLGALAGFIIPLGNIIVPLVIYLSKKDESEVIADQARESLNFQITITLMLIVALVLTFLLIGIFLIPVVILLQLIFIILAALVVDKNKLYRYPFSIRLVD